MRSPLGAWQKPMEHQVSMLSESSFRFLNLTHKLPPYGGWNDTTLEKLWIYNLHYFDDLNAQNAPARANWHWALILRWITENPPANGNAWEPYPTSLRIVNWIMWLVAGNIGPPGMANSLMLQACWLSSRLERHLLGNHLFANAKALVFAGLYFEGPQAAAWLAKGLKIIIEELPEQVLGDGGHFERSPMYHAIFLKDVLDLINAAKCWPELIPNAQVARWCETAWQMLNWLTGMIHPDGDIAFFNDAAVGVAPRLTELISYADRLAISLPNDVVDAKLIRFADSGYIRMQTHEAVALLDVAPIGPDYLPGHAHADTLSFELSIYGQRVVVNGGTSCYGMGPDRLSERGTYAHSTVEVAGANSSEVWGGFRVARRAYPFDLDVRSDSGYVACSHNGYKRLSGAPVHRRSWQMREYSMQVRDTVSGGKYAAQARYIFHPDIQVTFEDTNIWRLTLMRGERLRIVVQNGLGRIEPAKYAPEFGKQLHTKSLVIEMVTGVADTTFFWLI
jgi:uncharacterized heparinase superfamily protein